jgi:outer membrane protein insertion porin family
MLKKSYILPLLLSANLAFSATVDKVHFRGNRYFTSRELRTSLNWRNEDKFDSLWMAKVRDALLDKYLESGYAFAGIDSVGINYSFDSSNVELTFYLNEGLRIQRDDFEAEFEQILNQAEKRGYPFAMVKLDSLYLQKVVDEYRLMVEFKSEEGPQVRLHNIEVLGNKDVSSEYIVRESRLKAGALFSADAMVKAQRYLLKTELFRTVAPVKIVRRFDDYSASIKVQEARHNSLDGALGYVPGSSNQQGYITGSVDFSFSNLFGDGRKFRLHWKQPNMSSQELSLYYREPWIFKIPLDISAEISQSMKAYSNYDIASANKFITRSLSVTGYYALSEFIEVRGGMFQDEVIPDSSARYVSGEAHTLSYGVSAGFVIDYRDDKVNPRSGIYYSNTADFILKRNFVAENSPLPTEVEENRVTSEFESANAINRWNVIDVHIVAQHLESEQSLTAIPVSEMFFLGGANSLRGYRQEQFWGTTVAWANIEYRYLTGKRSRLYIFNDWGYYYHPDEANASGIPLTWNSLKYGYGIGMMLETGVGIIGIEFGWGEEDKAREGKVHLKILSEF